MFYALLLIWWYSLSNQQLNALKTALNKKYKIMIKPFKDIIPDNFNIAGMRYTVSHQAEQKGNTKYGLMNHPKCEVTLYGKMDDTVISHNQRVQTFWHEVVHGILENMGEIELSGNEKFVCTFSSFLNEVMQSSECEIHNPEPTKEPWEE